LDAIREGNEATHEAIVAKVAISAFADAESTETAAVFALASRRLRSGEMARGAAETDPATMRKRPRAWEASILVEESERVEMSKGRGEKGGRKEKRR